MRALTLKPTRAPMRMQVETAVTFKAPSPICAATERVTSAGEAAAFGSAINARPLAPGPTPNPSFKRTCLRHAA